MAGQGKIILVTGRITSGKTTFVNRLLTRLERFWRVDGFVCLSEKRRFHSGDVAREYHLRQVGTACILPWAVRNAEKDRFEFCADTAATVSGRIAARLAEGETEILVLDDLGYLEVEGRGFSSLLETALLAQVPMIVAAVKKDALELFCARFGIDDPIVIDLDETSHGAASKRIARELMMLDADSIGAFAVMAGGIEVSLGSLLHALHVPFKGHFLSAIQNALFAVFARELNGRSLVPIAFVSSAIKSFSPGGEKLKPMLYIFVQGALFAIPVMLFGLGFFSVALGSVLLNLGTVYLGLLVDLLSFGPTILDAYTGSVNAALGLAGIRPLGLGSILAVVSGLKAVVGIGITAVVWRLDSRRIMERLRARLPEQRPVPLEEAAAQMPDLLPTSPTLGQSAGGALRDLATRGFVLSFALAALLIAFFAGLSGSELAVVLLRGLVVSWFGFLVLRRIDFRAVAAWLERRGLGHVGAALGKAVGMTRAGRATPRKRKPSSGKQ